MTRLMRDAQATETNGGGQQGQQEEKGGKIEARFKTVIGKLSAIIGKEPDKKKKRKIPGSEVGDIVKGLFEKDHEAVKVEVEVDLKSLLEKYVGMNDEFDKKEKELVKLKEDKMKEFCEAGEKLFNKIDGIPDLEKKYTDAMTALLGAKV